MVQRSHSRVDAHGKDATGAYLPAAYLAGDAARAGRDDLAHRVLYTRARRRRRYRRGRAPALVVVSLDTEELGSRLRGWPAILAAVGSAAAGLATIELVRRSRFEAAR